MTKSPLLQELVDESIYIIREVAAQFENPVLLYSIGKDSSVLLHLIARAFAPGKIPFPALHVDTGYKFDEMYEFRTQMAKEYELDLIIHKNESEKAKGANPWDLGTQSCCGLLKTQSLLDALKNGNFDCAIGGARRDEEWSRAKERVFSFRDKFGQWDPRNQRPEIWHLYNGKIRSDESIRAFPLSNWTESDIWDYILEEQLPIVPLYFADTRKVIVRGEMILPVDNRTRILESDEIVEKRVRFRSLGCVPCTGAIESDATTLEEIVLEMRAAKKSERALRVIDFDEDSSMEKKKRMGYF